MDLNGNLKEHLLLNGTGNIAHYLPATIKNLKRKAHYAEVFPMAKFPAEQLVVQFGQQVREQ